EPRPQQGDDCTAAVFGVDAGAADLDDAVFQVEQPGEVEFVFGIIAADLACGFRRKNPVGADDATVSLVTHDQMLAVRVINVTIDAWRAARQACAQFIMEYAVTQFLRFEYFGFATCERDVEF